MPALAQMPVEPESTPAARPEGITLPTAAPDFTSLDITGLDARAFVSVASRADAERLLLVDRETGRDNAEWRAFFVEALVGFLVWQHEPWGTIAETDLDWLLGLVSDAPTPSTPALLFALVREVNEAPERLISLAMKLPKNRIERR